VVSQEDVRNNPVYEMGFRDGLLEAELKVFAHLYKWRLQRPLTEAERSALAQRVGKLSFDRLYDVSEELSPEALAAWLDDPATS
jgi:hypothetical protein